MYRRAEAKAQFTRNLQEIVLTLVNQSMMTLFGSRRAGTRQRSAKQRMTKPVRAFPMTSMWSGLRARGTRRGLGPRHHDLLARRKYRGFYGRPRADRESDLTRFTAGTWKPHWADEGAEDDPADEIFATWADANRFGSRRRAGVFAPVGPSEGCGHEGQGLAFTELDVGFYQGRLRSSCPRVGAPIAAFAMPLPSGDLMGFPNPTSGTTGGWTISAPR